MNKKLSILSVVLAAIGASCGEAAYLICPENTGLRTVCKAITGVCILVCAILRQNYRDNKWILAAVGAACVADTIIVSSFPVGAGLFAIAHICLIIVFYKHLPLTRKIWIVWGVISACLIAAILVLGSEMRTYAYGAAIYAPILLLMVFTAKGQKGSRRIAAFMFLGSDLILALFQWKHFHISLHVAYMGLFYAAMLMLAYYNSSNVRH